MQEIIQLFISFCKIGFTSFGGFSMIPLINSEMAAHHWMTVSEVSDIVAIAEMTPGPLGLNCATFAGMRVGGILGAIVANLGILMPTLTIGAIAALFFEKFKKSKVLTHMMTGVRPMCIGMIWAVIIKLGLTNYYPSATIEWKAIAIGLISYLMLWKYKLSIPKVILLAAMMGIVFYTI